MMKSLLLGTILGGLVAFLWSTISWEVLGWHEKSILAFQNDQEVADVLLSHSVQSGTYILPGVPGLESMTAAQKKASQELVMKRMQKGPIMFAAVRREGFGSFARGLVIQVLSLMAAAFLLTWLLLQTHGLTYGKRVIFLAVVGLAAGVIADLPNWNWWGFSGGFTAVNIADFTLTWLLAGLVIAKVAKT
jgi:hypothetical protein